jgi:CDP-glycerol glycerophosphotransferase (TagB/SpsB family)
MSANSAKAAKSKFYLKQISLLQIILCGFYACARPFIPTRRNRIALASYPDCADNAYAIFEEMMRSPQAGNFEFIWLVKDMGVAEQRLRRDYPHLKPGHVRIILKNSARGIFAFMRSRYAFFTHGFYRFAHAGFHQTIVNLWHGMPLKKIGMQLEQRYLLEPPFAHYSIATSDFFADVIAESLRVPRGRTLVTGLPRNGWLLAPDAIHAAISEGRGNMIVWLPTYLSGDTDGYILHDGTDGTQALSETNLAELDRKLDGADLLLVLKLHPFDLRNRQEWPGYNNIRVMKDAEFRARGLNIYKLLAGAHALITDFSSIAIDYLTVNKPIGVFAPDRGTYTRGFVAGSMERLEAVCNRLDSIDELAAFVRNLPEERPPSAELNDLHRQDLHTPSKDVLRAIGLAAFAP